MPNILKQVNSRLELAGPINKQIHDLVKKSFNLGDSPEAKKFALKYGPLIGKTCWHKDVTLPATLPTMVLVLLQTTHNGRFALRLKNVNHPDYASGSLYSGSELDNLVWKRPSNYLVREEAYAELDEIFDLDTGYETQLNNWLKRWKKVFPHLKLGRQNDIK